MDFGVDFCHELLCNPAISKDLCPLCEDGAGVSFKSV